MPIPHSVPSKSGSVRCGGGGSCPRHPQQQPGEEKLSPEPFPCGFTGTAWGPHVSLALHAQPSPAPPSFLDPSTPITENLDYLLVLQLSQVPYGLQLFGSREKYSPIPCSQHPASQGLSCGLTALWSFYSLVFDSLDWL